MQRLRKSDKKQLQFDFTINPVKKLKTNIFQITSKERLNLHYTRDKKRRELLEYIMKNGKSF